MSYIAIPRKYRPKRFSEVTGQEFITKTLKNAIESGRFAHAYIFAGPRGVGKTTTARIVAKALNCDNTVDGEPCNHCLNCTEIMKGSFPDVIEIDAATNRGIDQIRELREAVNYAPVKGKRKVYIIDEFHMLTKEAFNALLKTLEEPPEHVVFILATTEIDKIPPTILSRCQTFVFRKIPKELIVTTLKEICQKEEVSYEEDALYLIAAASEGCMRDAESFLDQAIALGNGEVKAKDVSEFLGVLTGKDIVEILKLSFSGDKQRLREHLNNLKNQGYNPRFIVKQLLEQVEKEFIRGKAFTDEELVAAFNLLSKAHRDIASHPYPYTALFFYLFNLSYFKDLKRIEELLSGRLNLPLPEKKSEEKADRNSLYEVYIEKAVNRGDFVEIVPKNRTAYERLKGKLKELENKFGKEVKLLEVESERKKREVKISPESEEKIDKLLRTFNAKLFPGYPKVIDESSNS